MEENIIKAIEKLLNKVIKKKYTNSFFNSKDKHSRKSRTITITTNTTTTTTTPRESIIPRISRTLKKFRNKKYKKMFLCSGTFTHLHNCRCN